MYGPLELCVAAVLERSENLANDERVGLWVLHHAVDYVQSGRLALLAGAGTFHDTIALLATPKRAVPFADYFWQIDALSL